MMKPIQPLLLVAAGALGATVSQEPRPQEPPPAPASGEVQQLAQKVAQLEKELGEVNSWVEAQQKQAKATQKTLDAVEAKGFTSGINFESRELLLKALRAEAKEAIGGAKDEKSERGSRGRRR